MASVFLSYDREDAAKAQAIATALEKAGHAVWWDRHIAGGAQFSKEIERALAAAEAVVVLWSTQSIDSDWVRDEAAAGRDRNILVPALLDGALPPMGFRQYQCVDLSKWRGRGGAPLKRLLAAIDGVVGNPSAEVENSPSTPRRPAQSRPAILAIAAVLLSAVVALLVWQPWRSANAAPLVTVVPAAPGPGAQALAADLLIKLGVLQSSHADALQLIEGGNGERADFIFKAAGDINGGQGALMLLDNRSGALLWSDEFSAPSRNPADLRQQMAYSAGKVLDCAVRALAPTSPKMSFGTLKLYLSGCAGMSDLLAQDPHSAVEIFSRVVAEEPRFADGWKKLIQADLQSLRLGGLNTPALSRRLKARIEQARKLHPNLAEIALAEAWLGATRPTAEWMDLIEQALAKDPANPEILAYRSLGLTNVGRMQDALQAARDAVKFDPLSPSARDALITALLNTGRTDEAKAELQKSENLWPGATSVLQARFAIEFRVGDAARAMRIMRSGELGARFASPTPTATAAHESYLKARMTPSEANKSQAIADARALYARDPNSSWVVARALSEFGKLDDLIAFLGSNDARLPPSTTWTLFRSSFQPLHNDPRFMRIARRFGLIAYWHTTNHWPDFCSRTDLPYDCKAEAAKLA